MYYILEVDLCLELVKVPSNIQENVEVFFENKLLKLKGPKGLLEMEIIKFCRP